MALKKILFVLSKENLKMARDEVLSLLKSMNTDFMIIMDIDRFLIIKLKSWKQNILRFLKRRLSLSHSVNEFLFTSRLENFYENVEKYVVLRDSDVPFKVIVNGTGNIRKKYEMECKVGKMISNGRKIVNVVNPKTVFEVFFYKNLFIFSKLLFRIDKKQFEKRSNKNLPFKKPVAMKNKIARALINLSKIKDGALLDPFCGTGSILIEACTLGLDVYGSDIRKDMVEGARKNLMFLKLKAKLKICDVRKLSICFRRKFDAIVCDMPYGRASCLVGGKKENLYKEAINEIGNMLRKNRYFVCVCDTQKLRFDEFEIESSYIIPVHKTLTRFIFVLRKL